MFVRKTLATLLAAAGLVAAGAAPGNAAVPTVVAFEGRITVTPSLSGQPQSLQFCFYAATCVNSTATPDGTATGAGVDTSASGAKVAQVVDGISGSATYVEACGAAGLAPTGTATITTKVHRMTDDNWSNDLTATWTRTGTVASISGDATGLALFIPLGVPACGQPLQVLVVGSAQISL
jgi:hypothetical protein